MLGAMGGEVKPEKSYRKAFNWLPLWFAASKQTRRLEAKVPDNLLFQFA